jgi:hypothetical protein
MENEPDIIETKPEKHMRRTIEKFAEKDRNQPKNSIARNGASRSDYQTE